MTRQVLTPLPVPSPLPVVAVENLHGFMRGTVIIPEGFDLTEPALDEPINADQGDLGLE
jgi:hypothetical protein